MESPTRNDQSPVHTDATHAPLHFPTQRPNEHVVVLLRRHWTTLAFAVMRFLLGALLPIILVGVLHYLFPDATVMPGTLAYVLFVLGLSLYYLFMLLAYFHSFIDYHLDIWVVTDERIVAVEQEGLFRRVTSELNIMNVQDVTSEVHGKLATFLNFGNVHIQTAGQRERFIFEEVPEPAHVAKIILQVHDAAVRKEEIEMAQIEADLERKPESDSGSASRAT